MTVPITINIEVGSTGAIATPPQTIWDTLEAFIAAEDPTYTILPAALIEDILSTDVPAVSLMDYAAVETINSLTPDGANPWLLLKLGGIYGVSQGVGSRTSVYCVFSSDPGVFIPVGFTVGDGTYQYIVQDGGSVASGGSTVPLFCLATQDGSWAVGVNTVVNTITGNPPGHAITVTNPNTGTPGGPPQTAEAYRAQVMQAGLASAKGTLRFLRTLLGNVPGVQARLVSPVQVNGGGWEIICGGGDPYLTAGAIYVGLFDVSNLVGSTIAITAITKANPGVVTTNLNHGLTTGQANVHIAGVLGMTAANGGPYTVTMITEKTFSFGVDTTGFGVYTSGGVVTPNARNISVNLIDYPDTYTIKFVNPPQQSVTIQGGWSTDSPNLVSSTAVQQLSAPAIAAYVNGLVVGTPINELSLDNAFKVAVAPILPPEFVSQLTWTVSINGVSTSPTGGTRLVFGDPESFFETAPDGSNVTMTQV